MDIVPTWAPLNARAPVDRWITAPKAPGKSRTRTKKGRKPSPYSQVTSRLNKRDAKSLPPGQRFCKTSSMPRSRTSPHCSKQTRKTAHPLTASEIREGWRYPPRRRTTYSRQFRSLLAHFKCANRFAALASLSHAQRRQLKDTGAYIMPSTSPTLRLPHPRYERKRRARMASVHMVQVREEDQPRLQVVRRITRSTAATMSTPPHFYSLSHPATPQAVFMDSPVVTTYMTSGEDAEAPLTPRAAAQRIEELEAELCRLKEIALDNNKEGLKALLSEGIAANPEVGTSSKPQPQSQIDTKALASGLQDLRASEPNSPRIQLPAEIPIDVTAPEVSMQKEMIAQMIADCLQKQVPHLPGHSSMILHKPYPAEIELEMLPEGLKMPKEQFDGTGSALRHLSRFHSHMGNWAQHSNFCLRMFSNSLTGDAFQWYTTLPAGSVKTWEQMQELFLSRFIDTMREIQPSELSTMTQCKDELVEEYIT